LRIGNGFDAHRFGEAQVGSIKLGGVSVPFDRVIIAHSDGDVLLHALCDALLGALALGDIGKHFPDTDPAFKNADSLQLLTATYQKLIGLGYELVNADLTLIAQAPRVANYIDAMQEIVAATLQVSIDCISVKATTTERMGYIGREEGLAAQATVLVRKIEA
jgi:2-C-methyl-D-erythritol 2,4-cyclodiphosphate synthase